ncbi:MAG: AmmeMemoRadiSam system protein B [Patescibacteria group bacterium]|nr:AmmeMemoRadiSam system protein B [Patescibacteria group bacterium]
MKFPAKKLKIILLLAIALLATLPACQFLKEKTLTKGSPASQESLFPETGPIPAQFNDKNFFLTAIKQSKARPLTQRITGIVVPHHLLARNIIADAFALASQSQYDRVIILSPDHYFLGKTEISYAAQDFNTVFGVLQTDQNFIKKLSMVSATGSAGFFYREHGIGAELPFIKYFFPNAKIIAITLNINARPRDLRGLVDFLKVNINNRTLLIQSTDFSHYLPAENAGQKDEQTVNLLREINEGADPQILYQLSQPDNIDCIACQYVQSAVQQQLFKTQAHIIAHQNSQDYSAEPLIKETTSYISQVYY